MSEEENKIILAESGPIRADRHETYVIENCVGCGTEVYFFKSERWANCFSCGAWTPKPKNGKAMTI